MRHLIGNVPHLVRFLSLGTLHFTAAKKLSKHLPPASPASPASSNGPNEPPTVTKPTLIEQQPNPPSSSPESAEPETWRQKIVKKLINNDTKEAVKTEIKKFLPAIPSGDFVAQYSGAAIGGIVGVSGGNKALNLMLATNQNTAAGPASKRKILLTLLLGIPTIICTAAASTGAGFVLGPPAVRSGKSLAEWSLARFGSNQSSNKDSE